MVFGTCSAKLRDKHLYLSFGSSSIIPSWLTNPLEGGINTGYELFVIHNRYLLFFIVVSSLEFSRIQMVLKLYGFPQSGAVRLVAFILREKKVSYEFVPIDFSKKEHKSPEYLEKQPFGQVPYIVCQCL